MIALPLVELVAKEDPVILDVGCNDGEHTQMFLDLFPHTRVFCFEPDPRAVQRFRKSVSDPRAELFEVAVGKIDGLSIFYQSDGWPSPGGVRFPEGWDLSGSIHRPTGHLVMHPWCTFDNRIGVTVVRLDTWAREHGVDYVDFIWADVQGAEGDLVMGAQSLLAHTRFFYTEYSHHELYEGQVTLQQLEAMLPRFEMMQTWDNDVLFRNRDLWHA